MAKNNVTVRYEEKRWVHAVKAIAFGILGYLFASLAIDTGGLWYYAFGILFIVLTLRSLQQLFKKRR